MGFKFQTARAKADLASHKHAIEIVFFFLNSFVFNRVLWLAVYLYRYIVIISNIFTKIAIPISSKYYLYTPYLYQNGPLVEPVKDNKIRLDLNSVKDTNVLTD